MHGLVVKGLDLLPKIKQGEELKDCEQRRDIICVIESSFISVGKRLERNRNRSQSK